MNANFSKVGICLHCNFVSEIVSGKGSKFIQCKKHFTNKDFPKYPKLPVKFCTGFQIDAKTQWETDRIYFEGYWKIYKYSAC